MTTISSNQRKLSTSLLARINELFCYWEAQTEETGERNLDAETQLQQLTGLGFEQEVIDFCKRVEQVICDSALVQFGKTAYASLKAVGFDCRSFEWMLEF